MPDPALPRIVLVAGVPRSGSTWAFNAARRLYTEAGTDLCAAWVDDWDRASPAPVHLVKAHQVAEVDFTPDLVLTTARAPADCIASLVRMGWVPREPEAIRRAHAHHLRLQDHWRAQSAIELDYDRILADPAAELARLAGVLGLEVPSDRIAAIAAELAGMRAPEGGSYDPETLLHPGHRAGAGEAEDTDRLRAEIRAIVDPAG